MKKACILVTLAVLSVIICAQSPQKMSYQCVVRNAAGALVTSHAVGIRVSILQGSATGTVVFSETYSPVPQTNANGLVTLEIGSGTASVGTFSGINWSAGPYYLKVETDPAGGTSYTITGTSQLLSVPYALYSKTSADAFSGNYNDLTNKPALATVATSGSYNDLLNKPVLFDGTFASLTGKPTTLAGYGITNAMSTSHPANVITAANITNWSTAYGWGNHAGLYRPITWVPGWSDVTGSPFLLNADTVYTMKNLAVGSNMPMKAQVAVVSEDDASDDPLFEVRRKDGQPIFTVYNDAVTINVPFPVTKGSPQRGGFAIGGFDETKGTYVTDLFRVTPDSVRIFINNNPPLIKGSPQRGGFAIGGFDETKGASTELFRVTYDSVRININNTPDVTKGSPQRGGFAIGGFDETKQEPSIYFDVSPNTGDVINPSENRILWYPRKNALLTGKVLIQHPDSVGTNSFASGFESKAKGEFSQALGYQAIARGNNSTSIGYQSVAHKNNAFAFGQFAQARNEETYAFGRGAVAEGFRSYSFGSAGIDSAGVVTGVAYAKGDYSFAIGQGSQALGLGSFAMGIADTAKATYSIAIGYKASSTGYGSISLGFNTRSYGEGTVAIGRGAYASIKMAAAIGYYTQAIAPGATAMGHSTIASNSNATAMGYKSTASGASSTAMGESTTAAGKSSLASGYLSRANSDYSTALGYNTSATGLYSTAMGYNSTTNGIGATAMGYETFAYTYSVAMGVQTSASGVRSTAMGSSNMAYGYYSTVMGANNTAQSCYETVIGRYCTNYSGNASAWNSSDRLFIIGNGTADASRSDAMVVLKNGNSGLGISAPVYKLDVNGEIASRNANAFRLRQANYSVMLRNDNDGFYLLLTNNGDPDGTWNSLRPLAINLGTGNVLIGINSNVGIGTYTPGYKLQVGNAGDGTQARANAWNLLSDASLKTGLTKPDDPIGMLSELNGYFFYWNQGADKSRQFGFIAQEVEKVLPEVVSRGGDGYLSLDYGKMTPLLVEAIKEQQKEIESYRSENENLKSQLQALQEKVDRIEKLITDN